MTDTSARSRWLVLTLARTVPVAGAVFGVVLAGRAEDGAIKALGLAIAAAGLAVATILPRHLARRWRTR